MLWMSKVITLITNQEFSLGIYMEVITKFGSLLQPTDFFIVERYLIKILIVF